MADLTQIVTDAKKAAAVAKQGHQTFLPILEEENIGYHVDKILGNYKEIRDALKEKPYLRSVLSAYMAHTVQEYKWMLYGAKTVDSVDKLTAVAGLSVGLLGPEAEVGFKAVKEPLEYILKVPYTAYYTAKSKDYTAPLYFIAAEAASLVPYAGEAVDMMDMYTNRLRTQMQTKTAQRFLEKIIKKESTAQDIYN